MRVIKRGLAVIVLIHLMVLVSADIISDGTSTEFLIQKGATICEDNRTQWTDYGTSETWNSLTDCHIDEIGFYENGISTQECCPSGYECKDNEESYVCVSNPSITRCRDYTVAGDCDSDKNNVGEVSIEEREDENNFCGKKVEIVVNNQLCEAVVDCGCIWVNDGTKDVCEPDFDYYAEEDSDTCNRGPAVERGTCYYQTTSDGDCSAGATRITVTYKQVWQDKDGNDVEEDKIRAGCTEEKTITMACEEVARLPFFGWINFVAALLILVGIYLIRINRPTKKIKRKGEDE